MLSVPKLYWLAVLTERLIWQCAKSCPPVHASIAHHGTEVQARLRTPGYECALSRMIASASSDARLDEACSRCCREVRAESLRKVGLIIAVNSGVSEGSSIDAISAEGRIASGGSDCPAP